jgi:hypothetical protein
MDNCSLPSSLSTISSNINIGDVLLLKALKSSWPLPAQCRLWPIKAGERDEPVGGREGARKKKQRDSEEKIERSWGEMKKKKGKKREKKRKNERDRNEQKERM